MGMIPTIIDTSEAAETAGFIGHGSCQQVREHFDKAFWAGKTLVLDWRHFKLALMREDKPILRLLVTWGAQHFNDKDLPHLKIMAKDKYPHYIKLLRQCGLKLSAAALEDIPYVTPEAPALNAERIPEEWLQVLRVFQDKGAPEAVIAGGALRDLFNDRAVKDVDIFLKTRGSEGKNRAFLKEVFNAAGLDMIEQPDHWATYFESRGRFPAPKKDKLSLSYQLDANKAAIVESRAESWTAIAGPQKTEYNIVFVSNNELVDELSRKHLTVDYFKRPLISGFDLGLCQIAYDGREVIKTIPYDNDVKNNQITLHNPNNGSKEHLERIAKKYPGWELCEKSKKLLSPPRPRSRWANHHGDIG